MSELVNRILEAMTAGAVAAAGRAIPKAVSDAYEGLKAGVIGLIGTKPKAVFTVDEFEKDPETWEKPLKKALQSSPEPGLLELKLKADSLMDVLSNMPGRQTAYSVQIKDSQGVQVGEGSMQHNQFGVNASHSKKSD